MRSIILPFGRPAANTDAPEGWAEIDLSRDRGVTVPDDARAFQKGPLRAIRSQDDGRWHLSVSCADRLPSWSELGQARDALLPPDVWLCQPYPPRAYWMNVHPFCLHLYEIRDSVLVRLWRICGELAAMVGKGRAS